MLWCEHNGRGLVQVSDRIEHINAVVAAMNDFRLTPSKIMQRLDLY